MVDNARGLITTRMHFTSAQKPARANNMVNPKFQYIEKVLHIFGTQKKELGSILLGLIGVSFLEAFGIGLVGPFASLATDPSLVRGSEFLMSIYKSLGFESERLFIASIGFVIIVIFCIKSVLTWKAKTSIYGFSSSYQVTLRRRLIRLYMGAPYTFHIGRSSANIINGILTETFNLCYKVANPLLELIANFLIVGFLILLLALTIPFTAIAALVIFLPLFFLSRIFRSSVILWGRESSQSNQEIVRVINHSLGSIKETKIIGCGPYFENQLAFQAKRYSRAQRAFHALSVTPRIILESLLIILLVGLISVFLILEKDVEQLTSTITIFIAASVRIIPSATQIVNGWATLKNSSYTVNRIYDDLKELEEIQISSKGINSTNSSCNRGLDEIEPFPFKFKDSLCIENLCFTYPSSEVPTLQNLSLTIPRGQSIALVGRSGAGKTTLADVILGLLMPQSGDIKVDGKSIYLDLYSWQSLVGYIPQSTFLIEDTIQRNIAFGVPDNQVELPRVQQAIEAAQLGALIDELPQGLQTVVGERGARLSGGQRQRVGIARALYHERQILVLDEATSALDSETEGLVARALEELMGKKTMIIIAHRLTTIKNCDCVYVMDKGQVRQSGSYSEIFHSGTMPDDGSSSSLMDDSEAV